MEIPIWYFGWYRLVFLGIFTNRYQRETRLVHFGIKQLAGALLYTLKRGSCVYCTIPSSHDFLLRLREFSCFGGGSGRNGEIGVVLLRCGW